MSRIEQLFKRKSNRILNVYCTAGYPYLNGTVEVMKALEENGADLIELGMPYSDPLADGPVIQHSSTIAIANGMTIETLFEQLKDFRKQVTVPAILMGYMNPILQYGLEKFCASAAAVGIDGIILPDLPMYEFETEYKELFQQHGLNFIFLITPETSEERIRKIDSLSSGFIYAVSSSSTTGNNKAIEGQQAYFKKLHGMKLSNPILVGFGIKDKQTFNAACEYTNGAIIGSAYIKALENSSNVGQSTKEFLKNVLG
jgi:tryptophan synthase alpha chain